MATFRALVVDKGERGQSVRFAHLDPDQLMDGDVTVRVTHSAVNYKDGLAVTGKAPVVRRFPMVPGIDLAGIVESSENPAFAPGDSVLVNGWGLGETHFGGYSQMARVKSEWLLPLPPGLTRAQAMAIGTAGYTAMLAVLALDRFGIAPWHGPAVVTGAAGGVGSVAVALLSKGGWHVIASTGRRSEEGYLKLLGAAEIIDRNELSSPLGRPLGKERWAAGIDSVGSHTLANVLAHTKYSGAVAATGLAQGMDLPGSVAPFILRGVSLLGIDSVMCPMPRRREAWSRLARDLEKDKLAAITRTIKLDQVIDTAKSILDGNVRGRVVVEIG